MDTRLDRPEERFAGDTALFDIPALASRMMDEATGSSHGRAQQTLHKHGGSTVALFAFDTGGGLPEHSAAGTVTVQVVAGEVAIDAAGKSAGLKVGQMLRISPGIAHSVSALCDAAILVHISLSAGPKPG